MAGIEKEEVDAKPSAASTPKTDPELIRQATLWHLRMGHANYLAVKEMPKHSTGMGVDFTNLNVEDIPPCEACKRGGMDPFSDDW